MNGRLVGGFLAMLREHKGWTQQELAEYLQVSRQAVSKWETGVSLPDVQLLPLLSRLYGIPIIDILEPRISGEISDFEEINRLPVEVVKRALETFVTADIAKASMGASPQANEYLEKLIPDHVLEKERQALGSIPVQEVEAVHSQIVSALNFALASLSTD